MKCCLTFTLLSYINLLVRELYDEDFPAGPVIGRDWWRFPNGQYAEQGSFGYYGNLDMALINGYYGDENATRRESDAPLPLLATLAANTCYRTRFINGNTDWPGMHAW